MIPLLLDLKEAALRKRRLTMALAALVAIDLAILAVAVIPLGRLNPGARRALAAQEIEGRRIHRNYVRRVSYVRAIHRSMDGCRTFRTEIAGSRQDRYLRFKQALEGIVGFGGSGATSISYQMEETDGGFLIQKASVKVEGSYFRLRGIVASLQAAKEFMIIERVSLRRGDKGNRSQRQPTVSLGLSTVFSQGDVPIGKGEQPVLPKEARPVGLQKTTRSEPAKKSARARPDKRSAKSAPGNKAPPATQRRAGVPRGRPPAGRTKPAAPADPKVALPPRKELH